MRKFRSGIVRWSASLLVSILITACGSGGGGSGESQVAVSTDGSPSIVGVPANSVTQGMAYSFIPNASDPDGDPLVFSVANRPLWASFNTGSGQLSGTPENGDVGDYGGIVISVSDGLNSTSLSPFSISVVGTATGSATLSWDIPVQNVDGSPLTDLAGFKVRYGMSAGNYANTEVITNPGISTYVVGNLAPATWFFVVTAFDTSGNESAYSDFASKTL